jgi:hypothetical protein
MPAHDDGRFHAEDATRMTDRDKTAAVPHNQRPLHPDTIDAFFLGTTFGQDKDIPRCS